MRSRRGALLWIDMLALAAIALVLAVGLSAHLHRPARVSVDSSAGPAPSAAAPSITGVPAGAASFARVDLGGATAKQNDPGADLSTLPRIGDPVMPKSLSRKSLTDWANRVWGTDLLKRLKKGDVTGTP